MLGATEERERESKTYKSIMYRSGSGIPKIVESAEERDDGYYCGEDGDGKEIKLIENKETCIARRRDCVKPAVMTVESKRLRN